MVTELTLLEQRIDREPEWFEDAVIYVCRNNLDEFRKYSSVLCLKPGAKNKHTDDFQVPLNNIIYAAIRAYNNIFINTRGKEFTPINTKWLTTWLTIKAHKGEMVAISEVPGVIKYFEDTVLGFDGTSEDVVFLVNTGIVYYLKGIRGTKIVNSANLLGTNLHDLSLMCSGEMQVIDRLQSDGDRIIRTSPLSVNFKDIPMYSDPIRERISSLTSGIPKLDEAVGKFRRGEAYLFIGGTGSGKTIVAAQFTMSFAFGNAARGLYVSTETPPEVLYRRMLSNKCSIPMTTLMEGVFESRLTPMEKSRIAATRNSIISGVSGDIHFVDWRNLRKGADFDPIVTLRKNIEEYEQETGHTIDFVVLDWIGGALGDLAFEVDKRRLIYLKTAEALEALAAEKKFVAIALCQATPASVNKSKIDSQDIAECKTMGNNYSGIIGITSLYSEEHAKAIYEENSKRKKDFRSSFHEAEETNMYAIKQYFSISKSRGGPPKLIPFKKEFEYQRIAIWT